MDYVPFLIFLLYLYMYLLCYNKRFWTLNFDGNRQTDTGDHNPLAEEAEG